MLADGQRIFSNRAALDARFVSSDTLERRQGGFEVPEIDLKSNSAALGFHVQRDRRNSTFYPTKGTLIDFTADFFGNTTR